MLQEYKTKTNIGVGLGILLQLVGQWLNLRGGLNGAGDFLLGRLIIFAGAICLVWGCMNYAEGKGHSKWFGLLGFFSCLGLLILILLPDHNK